MRVLAIDHGTKRIGLALSDELGIVAQPFDTLAAAPFDRFLTRLKAILKEKQVELVLVGMPRNMDGSYGPAALKVQEFVAVLKDALPVAIQTWDERLTSTQANRYLLQADLSRTERRSKVDKTAAAILLQSYLDSRAP
ncbi:MAG: Holliday junction resolvase RuvX [Verrucomicrobiota bacterium]